MSSSVKNVPKLALDAVFKQQKLDQRAEGHSESSGVSMPKADIVELKESVPEPMVTGIKLPT